MSEEIVTADSSTTWETTTLQAEPSTSTSWLTEGLPTAVTEIEEVFSTTENGSVSVDYQQQFESDSATLPLFEAFIIIEIVMTGIELLISIVAALKVTRWRRNYRNQMLMQLSLVRFIRRVFALIEYFRDNKTIPSSFGLSTLLLSSQIYIDFVIVILVLFFIKHMYDTLIVVLVKVSQNNLVKVLTCSWLVPLVISALGTSLVCTAVLTEKQVYLLICFVFRWPLMLIGTVAYIIILISVLKEEIRKFARSLTITTFLLCFIINLYLFIRDAIYLWCIQSFTTILFSYFLGFSLNVLILTLYIILITLNFQRTTNNSSLSRYHTKSSNPIVSI